MPASTSSNFQHKQFLDALLKSQPLKQYTQLWVALMTTVPGADGQGGTEVLSQVSGAASGYARVAIACDGASWTGPGSDANRTYSNTNDIVFGVPTANWGTIRGACLYGHQTNSTADDLIYFANLTTNKTVSNGDGAPRILANQLQISRASCP